MEEELVLVVDGDAEARAETATLLNRHAYRTLTAGSAAEAADLLERRHCVCAVVDTSLQDVGGVEAIPLLRAVEPELPIVVTTPQNTRELESAVRCHDVVYYYVKSFPEDELVEAVARAVAKHHHKQARVLVVDDDPDYQAAVRQLLENADYDVISAYTKQEGMQALREASPDLIVLDIMMEGISDGFHFLYEMRSDADAELPPVLSVSSIRERAGYDFSPTTDEGYFPADDFLSKPVEPGELLRHVELLLRGHRPPRESP